MSSDAKLVLDVRILGDTVEAVHFKLFVLCHCLNLFLKVSLAGHMYYLSFDKCPLMYTSVKYAVTRTSFFLNSLAERQIIFTADSSTAVEGVRCDSVSSR